MLQVLAGIYFILQGSKGFQEGLKDLKSGESFGEFGIAVAAVWDFLINWNTSVFRDGLKDPRRDPPIVQS
jgi:hypothetical protein